MILYVLPFPKGTLLRSKPVTTPVVHSRRCHAALSPWQGGELDAVHSAELELIFIAASNPGMLALNASRAAVK